MYQQKGTSFYNQNLKGNGNPNQRNNAYNNTNYNNNNYYYNNNNNNSNIYQRTNQNNFNNNKNKANQKYADLEIEAIFGNGSNQNISQKDMELKMNLESITKEYMNIFDNVNRLGGEMSNGKDCTQQLEDIKKELKDLEKYNADEHGNFISNLYDICNSDKVIVYDIDKYNENPKEADENLKKVISEFKYDILLKVNENNSEENKRKLRNYINSKKSDKSKNSYDNKKYENPNSFNNNDNYNQKSKFEDPNKIDSDYSNNNNYNNNNGKSIYNNQGNPSQSFNFGNNIYGNQNPPYGSGNNIYGNQNQKKFDNPNEIGNGDIYENQNNNYRGKSIYGNQNNNYNPNAFEPNYNTKIKVKFFYKNQEKENEFQGNDKGEMLYYFAMEMKVDGDPAIYDNIGKIMKFEDIKDTPIKDIFKDIDPIIKIY